MLIYFSGAAAYSAFLIFNFFSDEECPNTDITSWLIVAIASLLWVIVLPISLVEIKAKAKSKNIKEDAHQIDIPDSGLDSQIMAHN